MTRHRNPLRHEKLAGELIAKYEALRTELLRSQNIMREANRTALQAWALLRRLPPIERGQLHQNCKEVCQVPRCRD